MTPLTVEPSTTSADECNTTASASPASPAPALADGIVSGNGCIAYVVGVGGLEALELGSGRTLWSSPTASQPLAIVSARPSDVLAAVAVDPHLLRILFLDPTTGTVVRTSEPVALPTWASVSVSKGEARGWPDGGVVATRAVSTGNPLVVEWHANLTDRGGAQGAWKSAPKDARGHVAIDLATGAVHAVEVAVDDVPAALRAVKSVPFLSEEDGTWHFTPIVAGDHVVALSLAVDPTPDDAAHGSQFPEQRFALRRWDRATGAELPIVPLLPGRSISPAIGGDQLRLRGDEGTSVYSLATGALIGRFPKPGVVVGARWFVVAYGQQHEDGFAIVTPRTLTAFDAKTQRKLWDHPVAPARFFPGPP